MVSSLSLSTKLLGLAMNIAVMQFSASFESTFVRLSPRLATNALMVTADNIGNVEVPSARKQLLQTMGVSALGWALSSSMPNVAFAAENDDSTTSSELVDSAARSRSSDTGFLPSSPNIRSLKRAEKQLSKMEFYAVDNDYEAIKLAIRNAPFSDIRKNSFALIKEYASQPEQQSKLTASYEAFISSLEKMDSAASLGMRGRKLDNGALLQSYQATSLALNEWIAVASAVSESS